MKKLMRWLLALFIVLPFGISFQSCDDESEKSNESGLIGMWRASAGSYQGESFLSVYEFINENTVIAYSTVSSSSEGWRGDVDTLPEHSGWYYSPSAIRYLTYYIVDNKIYITDGTILTLLGTQLVEDDSSVVYTKW